MWEVEGGLEVQQRPWNVVLTPPSQNSWRFPVILGWILSESCKHLIQNRARNPARNRHVNKSKWTICLLQQSDGSNPPENNESGGTQNFLSSEELEISQENVYRTGEPKYRTFSEQRSKFTSSQRLCVLYSIQPKADQRLFQAVLKLENITTPITLAVQDMLQMYGLDFNPTPLVTQLCRLQAGYQFAEGHWGPFQNIFLFSQTKCWLFCKKVKLILMFSITVVANPRNGRNIDAYYQPQLRILHLMQWKEKE